MNFYEYLKATGKDRAAEIIDSEPESLPEAIHNTLLEDLRQYMYIGGMPECVKLWIQTNSITEVFGIQTDIIESYRQDFSKYAPYADSRSLNNVLGAVATRIGNQIKYTQLSDEYTGPTNKKAFDLLMFARVIDKVRAASHAALPLSASASEKRFKAIMVDIGLMRALNNLAAKHEYIKSDLLSMYNGAMAEQFAGQEFASCGNRNLYYWSRVAKGSSAEVDYLSFRRPDYPAHNQNCRVGYLFFRRSSTSLC